LAGDCKGADREKLAPSDEKDTNGNQKKNSPRGKWRKKEAR